MSTMPVHSAQPPRIGMAMALFLPRTSESLERVVGEFERYTTRWGSHLRWWSDNEHEEWRLVTPEILAYPRRRLLGGRRRKARGYDACAHGAPLGHHVDPMFVSISARDSDLDEVYGILQMWSTDVMGKDGLADEALAAARRLQPLQGYAGYALAPQVDPELCQRNCEIEFALAQQLEGVEIPTGWFTVNAKPDSLCSVQWITIVADSILSQIGGRAALRDLPSDVRVHDYGAGVLIQAGDAPSAGDVNKGETIPLYRAVARKLAPTRVRNPLPLNIEEPRSLSREETAKWVRRLEREP